MTIAPPTPRRPISSSSSATRCGANTVRLPINPSSVGTDWWESYQGAIDAATRHGFKVILSYWEGDNAKDGRVDDQAAFDAMWDTVVASTARIPASTSSR